VCDQLPTWGVLCVQDHINVLTLRVLKSPINLHCEPLWSCLKFNTTRGRRRGLAAGTLAMCCEALLEVNMELEYKWDYSEKVAGQREPIRGVTMMMNGDCVRTPTNRLPADGIKDWLPDGMLMWPALSIAETMSKQRNLRDLVTCALMRIPQRLMDARGCREVYVVEKGGHQAGRTCLQIWL
jgi:hypothetical protein